MKWNLDKPASKYGWLYLYWICFQDLNYARILFREIGLDSQTWNARGYRWVRELIVEHCLNHHTIDPAIQTLKTH